MAGSLSALNLIVIGGLAMAADIPPQEPLEIGMTPQFVFDNHVVDNHWAIRYKKEAMARVFHQAAKHPNNPLLPGDQPSYCWVVRDEEDGLFRMWYQANLRIDRAKKKGRKYRTYVAYAQSKDGVQWEKPSLDLFEMPGVEPNNVVLGHADAPDAECCSPCILDLPERDRRGYRYVMMYRSKGAPAANLMGIRIVGSHDGIHWDMASDTRIAHLHSDHPNTVSYDPIRDEYVMFCRGKHIYRTFRGAIMDTGASRRVSRMSNKELWTEWTDHTEPQTILIPDEIDSEKHFNFFYGMPTRYFAGIYWGFLEPFRMNDYIYTELAVSRDSVHFLRLPGRPKMIEYGPEGSWDDTMIFASPSWVEVGDEWWIYYSAWDGPHGTAERTGAIGLATIRKEGFISMRGPRSGGALCTRKIRWPGGGLMVNADAREGELRVRVSDAKRKPIAGLDYDDCQAFTGDSVSHEITWREESIRALEGQTIRLEVFLKDAELFTFRATGKETR